MRLRAPAQGKESLKTSNEKTLRFVIAAALLVGALYAVSGFKKPPPLPRDADHAAALGNESCRPCHGKGMPNALSRKHPPKDDCLHCHPTRE